MPRINLNKMLPMPDAKEDELVELARVHGFSVRINGRARHQGQPHLELFKRGSAHGEPPAAVFSRAATAIKWLEEGRQFASPT